MQERGHWGQEPHNSTPVLMTMLTTITKTTWTAENSTTRMMPGTQHTMTSKTETLTGEMIECRLSGDLFLIAETYTDLMENRK